MWEDPVEVAVLSQSLVEALPVLVMGVLARLLIGFAIALAIGLVGVIASLALDTQHPRVLNMMS